MNDSAWLQRMAFVKRLPWLVLACAFAVPHALADSTAGRYILPIEHSPLLTGVCSRGVPRSIDGYWLPAAADIDALEQDLPGYLAHTLDIKGHGESYSLTQFRRQYIGFISHGRRFIYGNFYPSSLSYSDSERAALKDICDGGPLFWGVVYSVDNREFSQLAFNGIG